MEEKVLHIIRGEEYSISIKDYIYETDFLWEEYKRAAVGLMQIVEANRCNLKKQSNNIIAFCGDRGTGKTSAMATFCKAIMRMGEYSGKELFSEDFVKDYDKKFFLLGGHGENPEIEGNIIDPSALDGKHGILDIVLPRLFTSVNEVYNDSSKKASKISETDYDDLMGEFQKVFRNINVLETADTRRSYEETIYDRERLYDLSSAIDLKSNLSKLVKKCLEFEGNKAGYYVLMIDDVDLACENAYRVMEEIRKYLMIPQLIVLISVRTEQMEMCIQENNYSVYPELSKHDKDGTIASEIKVMASKYLLKIIPESRRVLLDKSADVEKYQYGELLWEHPINKSIADTLLKADLAYVKEDNVKAVRPDNLRALINFILFFRRIEFGDDEYESFDVEYDEDTEFELKIDEKKEPAVNVDGILSYIQRVLIRDAGYLISKERSWDKLIEAPANRLLRETNTLLKEYGFQEIRALSNVVSITAEEKSAERVLGLILFILALKREEVNNMPLDEVLSKEYWTGFQDKLAGNKHFFVNTKEAIEKISGQKCPWLREQAGQNGKKLVLGFSGLSDIERVEAVKDLYHLLLFTDVDDLSISKTSASFINKEIQIGYDYFIRNMCDIDDFMNNSILDFYFDKDPDTEEKSLKEQAYAVLDELYGELYRFMDDIMKDIIKIKEMTAKLAAGRTNREKQEEGKPDLEIKRIVISLFGKDTGNVPAEHQQMLDALDLFTKLEKVGSLTPKSGMDKNKPASDSFARPRLPQLRKNSKAQTIRNRVRDVDLYYNSLSEPTISLANDKVLSEYKSARNRLLYMLEGWDINGQVSLLSDLYEDYCKAVQNLFEEIDRVGGRYE